MYALAPASQTPDRNRTTAKTNTTTPHLLPCKIHHDGPVPTDPRYWSPATDPADGTRTAYLRGRKLAGRALRLPAGYTGLVLQKTDRTVVEPRGGSAGREEEAGLDEEEEEEEGMGEEVKILERRGEFEEVVVWGHEAVAEGEDVYVRGIEEWIGFAEAMHCDDKPTTTAMQTNGAS